MTMKDEEWEVLDRKELGIIRFFMDSLVAFNISKEKTTEGVMSALDKLYEKTLASNKVFSVKSLFNMKMPEGGYVVDYLNEFNSITSKSSMYSLNQLVTRPCKYENQKINLEMK